MRMSREELLAQFPSWNEEHSDIVAVHYGDEPAVIWDEEQEAKVSKYTGTLSNILAVDRYIYKVCGDYREYRVLIGNIYERAEDGEILCGSLNLKYGGTTYSLYLGNKYTCNHEVSGLDVLKLTGKLTGWSNATGLGSPCHRGSTTEMDKDLIEKLLSIRLEDYGEIVNRFIAECERIYHLDTTNHIMEKCFNK